MINKLHMCAFGGYTALNGAILAAKLQEAARSKATLVLMFAYI